MLVFIQIIKQKVVFFSNRFLNTQNQGNLNFSIKDYIDSFLDSIVSKNYIINNNEISLVDTWGKNYNNFFPLGKIARI